MIRMSSQIAVNYTRFVCALAWITFFLVAASISAHLALWWEGHGANTAEYIQGTRTDGAVRLLSLDRENNVPTLFSTALLATSSVLYFIIAAIKRSSDDYYALHWKVLGFGFLAMAIDESFSVHEKLSRPLREMVAPHGGAGILYFAWVIPGILVVSVVGVTFLRFFLAIPTKLLKGKFMAAATLYLAGAIGFELVGGYVAETYTTNNLIYVLIVSAEEALEMSGLVLLIWALTSYIDVDCGNINVLLVNSSASQAIRPAVRGPS